MKIPDPLHGNYTANNRISFFIGVHGYTNPITATQMGKKMQNDMGTEIIYLNDRPAAAGNA